MKIWFIVLATLFCVSQIIWTNPEKKSVLIENIPHIKQKPDFCGEACVAMYLQKLGKKTTQDDVFHLSGLDPTLGRGCYTPELARGLKKIGFEIGTVWFKALGPDFTVNINKQWNALYDDLQQNIPSIVCMRYSDTANATEHFRLIVGYDAKKDSVLYHEPAIYNGAYQQMPLASFLNLWPLKYQQKAWTIIRMPLALRSNALENFHEKENIGNFSSADYAQHVLELKKKLPDRNFTIVIEPPFVVIGDEYPVLVHNRSQKTIRWAVNALKKEYFTKDPDHIINIWLFKNKKSYEENVYKLFGAKPKTPFGYYSLKDKALVMNISTGGGTLVHELVHPFIYINFPECPSWFNEGLASLYEQCSEQDGQIHGLTNWRLKGLKKAILSKKVPTFKYLMETTKYEFYQEDPGTNYSQARYLCYYLQQKKLLHKFYHEFRRNYKNDPSGYKTLQQILGTEDMHEFHENWRHFVLDLSFP